MRYNKAVLYSLLVLLVSFLSCSKMVSKNEKSTSEEAEEAPFYSFDGDASESVEDAVNSAKAEFERMKAKPILHFYTAVIDGEEVQVRQSSALSGEEDGAYIYVGVVGQEYRVSHLESEDEVADSILVRNGANYWRHQGAEYLLSASKVVDFELYSDLDYKIIVANSIKPLEEDDYWRNVVSQYEARQSFVPRGKTNLYNKVFASDAFIELTRGEHRDDLKTWNYRMSCDTIAVDEAQFVQWDISKVSPLRFDSVIFVVQTVNDMYMGGAHGIGSSASSNFDVKTGKLLVLTDIVDTDSDIYNELLKNKINETYDLSDYVVNGEVASSFTIYSNGIVLTFPPYSLGGGFWEKDVFLSYKDLGSALKKEYYRAK